MKKIICTVTNDLTYDQRMIRICGSLARAGFLVELVGRKLPGSKPLTTQPFRQKRFRLLFTKGKLFYLEHHLRLFFYLLFSRFYLVCAVDLDTLLPGFFVSKMRGKVCVFDAHEYFTEVPEVVERPLVKRVWEAVARFAVPRLRYACTVCESLAEIFERRYGTRFLVIRNVPLSHVSDTSKVSDTLTSLLPHVSDTSKVSDTLTSLPPHVSDTSKVSDTLTMPLILIYQGVLNDGRGLEEAIEAMRHLENVELWLVGEGDLSLELRSLVAKFQLGSKVKFLGKVAPQDLPALTRQAHVGLNLLKNKGLNYYYSLANKVFDYVQAGIPCLCMDFPEYRKLNAQFEVFHLVGDLETATLVQAIEQLRASNRPVSTSSADRSTLYRRLQSNCHRAARQWVWEREEEKLLEFYRPLIG